LDDLEDVIQRKEKERKDGFDGLESQSQRIQRRQAFAAFFDVVAGGKFQGQADAKWIVIRGSLWGHNDIPCGLAR
jgi:hypothetical protein